MIVRQRVPPVWQVPPPLHLSKRRVALVAQRFETLSQAICKTASPQSLPDRPTRLCWAHDMGPGLGIGAFQEPGLDGGVVIWTRSSRVASYSS
jgi:hypothetical protein